ncbi:MAG TPA: alpha/beta family hydrolase [Acidimicrobiales bacterium]|nr:alpha/beta family hydrolase [Acidimicrobiales bacterium]
MSAGALLLFPGAGSSSTHPSLVAIEKAVAPLPVVRADFPYRKAGRAAPDRPPVLLSTVRDEAAALVAAAHVRANRLVLGGRSMGGRICSMAVADGLPAAGLVLISYPLHPPGKLDQLRVEHLPRIEVPCLFISGTSDSFGTPEELERATALVPGPVEHVWIKGGRHELKGKDAEIAQTAARWIKSLKSRR